MLFRLRRRSAFIAPSVLELTEGVRRPLTSRLEELACIVLIIVDRLLVRDGTSSTEIRTSCIASPVVHELMVRLSVMEEADVPTRDVSNELCRRAKSGDENADEWYVSGVTIDCWPSGSVNSPVGAARRVGVSLESDDLVKDCALGSS